MECLQVAAIISTVQLRDFYTHTDHVCQACCNIADAAEDIFTRMGEFSLKTGWHDGLVILRDIMKHAICRFIR